MTVESRRRFETLLLAARQNVVNVRLRMHELWLALAEKTPEPGKVNACAARVCRALDDAHATFATLRGMAPRNASLLSEYASFLTDDANEVLRGRLLQVWPLFNNCINTSQNSFFAPSVAL